MLFFYKILGYLGFYNISHLVIELFCCFAEKHWNMMRRNDAIRSSKIQDLDPEDVVWLLTHVGRRRKQTNYANSLKTVQHTQDHCSKKIIIWKHFSLIGLPKMPWTLRTFNIIHINLLTIRCIAVSYYAKGLRCESPITVLK